MAGEQPYRDRSAVGYGRAFFSLVFFDLPLY
jgi:hypothetical protein